MEGSALQLVLHAGFLVKVVLLILSSFSIFSWGIILYKAYYLKVAVQESEKFVKAFLAESERPALVKLAKGLLSSPLANVFTALHLEQGRGPKDEIRKSIRRYETRESEKLYAYLTFLATTGSTTPFIGLLGTVWGIMNAFRGIGATGSASLAVVAPGIAEALITTAAGLAAAIPAVIAYNYFLSRARSMTVEMEDFSEELIDFFSKRAA